MVPFILFVLNRQVCLPIMCGSFETEVCVSDSRSTPIYGVNHKTVISVALWPFLLRVGPPFQWAIQTAEQIKRLRMIKIECLT